MTSVHFQGKSFKVTVIQVYAPTTNTEEAEVLDWFFENLQDLLELATTTTTTTKMSFSSYEIGIQK